VALGKPLDVRRGERKEKVHSPPPKEKKRETGGRPMVYILRGKGEDPSFLEKKKEKKKEGF